MFSDGPGLRHHADATGTTQACVGIGCYNRGHSLTHMVDGYKSYRNMRTSYDAVSVCPRKYKTLCFYDMGVADGYPSTARSHIFVCLKDSSRAAKEQVHLPFKKSVVSGTTFDYLVRHVRIAVCKKSVRWGAERPLPTAHTFLQPARTQLQSRFESGSASAPNPEPARVTSLYYLFFNARLPCGRPAWHAA